MKNKDVINNIVEISKLVTSSTNFFEIKDKIIEKMLNVIHPTKACINLFFKNNYKYSYLVCSATLDYIPKLFSEDVDEDAIKIDFNKYPKYIHEAVFEKKIVWVKNVFEDERAVIERPIAKQEGYVGRIVFPLIANNNVVGFITCYLGEEDDLTTEDINFVSSVSSLISLSIEITKENNKVDTLIKKLRGAINYISKATQELYANKTIDSFLSMISKQMCKLTLSKSAIVILNDIEHKTQSFNQYGNENINLHKALEVALKNETKKNGIYYNFNSIKEDIKKQNIKSLIYYKLKRGNEIIGYIAAANSKKYTDDDIKILSIFSSQIVVALQMYINSKKAFEHKLLEKELELVSNQQKLIMSESQIKFSDLKEISFFHKPSKYIGGDFCEIIKIDENRVCIFIADVMGHGILSNYFVAMIKGVLQTLVYENRSPGSILTKMNKILYKDFDKVNIFATARVGIFNSKDGKGVVSNAGHYHPLGIKKIDNNILVEELDFDKGMPIGVLEDMEYKEYEYNLNEYELICMFTDGVIEASNKEGEEYGLEGLKEFIYNNYNLNSGDIFENLKKELYDFTGKDSFDDDVLILFITNRKL
ncbi:GAF domain-containing SpoIIE family protein phosphatase [Tepidibacter formicigenes]|jgi:serine phosphatase RsbU (regulator of sigma subunit)|uniref:Serine phosphatase RsbU, regulator of sigma subunit n=1 Tax=Tepidibacter formicigenes DSM 15518 TaxID=1123349 RepID=A0A1M6P4W7_9FIRM|nr:GAF domain-containing SpoIIE family protein phosphatase [Tepidibacter formicigenes]SHK03009.1 Serine phosphatase RsbU, regulator of sigma subunit [Tepidibacter formicigenes DSM 15518]